MTRFPDFRALAQLLRPANLPTAAADILAGASVAALALEADGALPWAVLLPAGYIAALVGISVLLYASGVVLNDYYDRDLDAVERPERPIPSGAVPAGLALALGWGLAGLALFIASLLDIRVLGLAMLLFTCIWFYDYRAKRYDFWGPFFMGSCRALNLLLGMSPLWTTEKSWLALAPLAYIFAVTTISRGEVHGGSRGPLLLSAGLYLGVVVYLFAWLGHFEVLNVVVMLGLCTLADLVLYPLYRAWQSPEPGRLRTAVKAGVLSLVVMDAAIGLAFGGWVWALLIGSMAALSLLFSRFFQVT